MNPVEINSRTAKVHSQPKVRIDDSRAVVREESPNQRLGRLCGSQFLRTERASRSTQSNDRHNRNLARERRLKRFAADGPAEPHGVPASETRQGTPAVRSPKIERRFPVASASNADHPSAPSRALEREQRELPSSNANRGKAIVDAEHRTAAAAAQFPTAGVPAATHRAIADDRHKSRKQLPSKPTAASKTRPRSPACEQSTSIVPNTSFASHGDCSSQSGL